MIVLFYGNCQLGMLVWMLKQVKLDLDIRLHYSYENEEPPEELYKDLSECDIFIYHPVLNHRNDKLNTESLCKNLGYGCIQVRVQNLYFTPYFPDSNSSGINKYMIRRFKELTQQPFEELANPNAELLVSAWLSGEHQRASKRQFDIQMTDWILQNHQKEKLFYTVQHCSNRVYLELLRRLFDFLNKATNNYFGEVIGVAFGDLELKLKDLHNAQEGDEWPIMEEVKNALGLTFDCERSHIKHKFLTRDEYILQVLQST